VFLTRVKYEKGLISDASEFPFNIPLFEQLDTVAFDKRVTLFVGENGTGKSTLLEGIAAAIGSITVGVEDVLHDPSLDHAKKVAPYLKLSWRVKTKKGFFLRAEDFLSFSKKMKMLRAEMQRNLEQVEEEYKDRSDFARNQARSPYLKSIAEMDSRYGVDLDARSHGESFLKLFQSRLIPNGLYLLDEPETPLSPMKQLGFLSLIKEMTEHNCQFIIATHSPILMAYPDAAIYSFDESPPAGVSYNELEHVNLTRDFLNSPERFIRHL
jgi:predicted ATPase